MNHLDRSRFAPELAVALRGGGYESLLAPDVPIHGLSTRRIPSSLGRLTAAIPRLRSLITSRGYDVVCSLMDLPNLATLGAVAGLRSPPKVVLCVQIPPSIEYRRGLFGRTVLGLLTRSYVRADRVVALSNGVRSDLLGLQPALARNTVVIHNACVDERLAASAASTSTAVPKTNRRAIVAVGRLVPQKGYDHLLAAFAMVRASHDVELWIVGEGPLRGFVEAEARRHGIDSYVRLLGQQRDPFAFMRAAEVFTLSSNYEGFGNVIVEALACGTPVVSTNCPHGPAEILREGASGLLVPVADPPALAAALRRVLDDRALRATLIEGGRRRALDFHAAKIAREYESLFEELTGSVHAA